MSKNIFNRTKVVLLETAQELIFGFDTAHPERAQPRYRPPEPAQEKQRSNEPQQQIEQMPQ